MSSKRNNELQGCVSRFQSKRGRQRSAPMHRQRSTAHSPPKVRDDKIMRGDEI